MFESPAPGIGGGRSPAALEVGLDLVQMLTVLAERVVELSKQRLGHVGWQLTDKQRADDPLLAGNVALDIRGPLLPPMRT